MSAIGKPERAMQKRLIALDARVEAGGKVRH
jgi:hypothetical protein